MRRLTLVLAVILALSFTAMAQDFPRMEVSGGYQFVRIQTGTPTSFGAINSSGVGGNFAYNFSKAFGVVGDIGLAKVTKTGRTDDKLYTFLFGPQVKYHGEARLHPFARVLVGAVRCSDGYQVGTPMVPNMSLSAQNTWAYGMGGGADMRVNDVISLRVAQVDYIRSHFADYHQSNLRIMGGITFQFGAAKTK